MIGADDTVPEAPSLFGFSLHSWRRVSGEAGWVLGGQLSTAIAGLVGIRLLTELAPGEVLGQATLYTGSLMLVKNLIIMPVANGVPRFYPMYFREGRARWFMHEMNRLIWIATIICLLLSLPCFFFWQRLHGQPWRVLLSVALAGQLLVDSAKNVRGNRLACERRQRSNTLWTSVEGWLSIGLAALLLWISPTVESYLLGQAIAVGLAAIIFGWIVYPPVPSDMPNSVIETREQFTRKIFAYGLPFAPLAVVSWISNLSDRFLLGGMMGSGVVGIYSATYSVASRPFLMLGGFFTGFARPILFEAESRHDGRKAQKIFLLWMFSTAAVGAVSTVGLWLAARFIAAILLAQSYRETAPRLLPWIGLGYTFFIMCQIVENRLLSLGKSGRIVWPTIAGAVGNTVMNLLLIPRYGMVGAAVATTGAFAIQFAAIIFMLSSYRRPQAIQQPAMIVS